MATTAPPPLREHLTVAEFEALYPEGDDVEGLVELLDGVVLVSGSPLLRHGRVVGELFARLHGWCAVHGGAAFTAPTAVRFADDTMLQPDVLVIAPGQLERLTDHRYVTFPPALVLEVSSPSTRSRDLGSKRDAYQRFGVAEYWFFDLSRDVVLVHVRDDRGFAEPRIVGGGEVLRAAALEGFEVAVDAVLDPH